MRVALTPPALKRDRFCTVVSVTDTGDGDLVSFEGIDDLTAAEGITGCYVLANRDDFELDSLDEDYTTGMSWPLSVQAPGAQVSYPYTVPDDCVWVMGDNRENSADSRYFGPVDRSDLIAVALVRYWPLNRIGAID